METKYVRDVAERLKTLIAVHEVLQQSPILIEGTGNFVVSSWLLRYIPVKTESMNLNNIYSSNNRVRMEIRKGLLSQGGCNSETLRGSAEIKEFKKSSNKKNAEVDMFLTWFDVKNPELCRPHDSRGPSSPLMELAFNNVFGMPSVALFALACSGNAEKTCGLVDFQTLTSETADTFLAQPIREIIVRDYRTRPYFDE